MEALLVLLGIAWALLPFGLLFAHVAHRKAARERDEAVADQLATLSARILALERRDGSAAAPAAPAAPRRDPDRTPVAPFGEVTAPTFQAPRPAPPPSVPPASAVAPASAVPPSTVTPTPPAAAVSPQPPRDVTPTPTAVEPPPRAPAPIPDVTPTPTVSWPRPPPPPPPERSRFVNPLAGFTFDWERLVGVKLFSWLAGIAVVVAAVSFLRYSVEHGLLSPPVRMVIGLAVGIALLVGCETRPAQRYKVTAQALAAAGIATLFSTFYAAHAIWQLLPALPTFGLLALVTAVAVVLSIRRNSVFVAILGLVGGFATPALLSTGKDQPIGLFSYLLLLDVGLAWVAYRKRWPLLSALSLGFTALYQAGWVARFLDETKLPIAVAIFLVFPILGFVALGLSRRGGRRDDESRLFGWTAALGAVPPVLFAVWFAVSGAYGGHWALLLGFLALVAAGLAAVAAWQGPEWLHLAGGAGVLATVAGFLARAYTPDAWPGVLPLLVLLAAIYLAAPPVLARLGRDFRAEGRLAVYTAPLLLLALPVLAALEPRAASAPLLFGPLLLVAAGCAAFAVLRGDGPVHFLAAAFAVATEATWSAYHLAPERLLPALAVYGAFGLFFLAVPLLAERLGRPLRPAGSGSLLVLASLALLLFLAAGPVASIALGGLAVLAALLEAGLLFEASRNRSPLLAVVGLVLGFGVLAVWWAVALTAALLVPALAAAGGLALLAVGGTIWAGAEADRRAAPDPDRPRSIADGAFVGLAGHAFLVALVVRPELATPPWPWLAVLGVLDLAFLVAALQRRHGGLAAGAFGGTALVLVAPFAFTAAPAPDAAPVAVWAALAAATLGLAGFLLSPRRAPGKERSFGLAAAVALFGGEAVVALASATPGAVALPLEAGAQVALVAGLLLLAWRMPDEGMALAAAVTGAAVAAVHRLATPDDPAGLLWVAAPLYALPLAYPLLRFRRAPGERLPFFGAILASAAFFLLARGAVVALGGAAGIGLLPVAQAFLLVPHLVLLVRAERLAPAEGDRGRLAVVAGACLAFVTVAIPLQLEKQWITIGWALEGAALAWLFRRIRHRGLLAWSAALFAAAFVRLALNPSVLEYHAKSATPLWNWYLYAYAVAAAAFFAGAWLLRGTEDRFLPGWPRAGPALAALGTVLLFLLVNLEIADFYSAGPRIEFRFSAGLAQDLTYTIAWALFAIGVLVAGVVSASRPARVAAIVLLAATVLKAFLHDLARLSGLYRVASFVGLAVSLALVAVVLQRFVLGSGVSKAQPQPPTPPEAA